MGMPLPMRWSGAITVLGLVLGWFAIAPVLGGDEVPRPDTTLVVDPELTPEPAVPSPVKPDEKERRVKLTAGLAALAGITILGVVLGAVIIIWAGRLRRMVREPLEATGKQDPFWFLRPTKSDRLLSPKDEET